MIFSYFLVADMFLYVGVSGCPHVCTPLYIHMPPCLYAPRGVHTPHMPLYSSVHLYVSWRLCMLWGVVMGSPLCWDTSPYTTHVWRYLPFNYTSTLSCWFPVHQYVSGISVCYVGISLLSARVWGVSPISLWGVGGIST